MGGEFAVNLKEMKAWAEKFDEIYRAISESINGLEAVRSSLSSNGLGYYRNAVRSVEEKEEEYLDGVKSLETSLVEIINCYQQTECRILGETGDAFSLPEESGFGEWLQDQLVKLGLDTLGEFGLFGSSLAAIPSLLKGGSEAYKKIPGLLGGLADGDLWEAIANKDEDAFKDALKSLSGQEDIKKAVDWIKGLKAEDFQKLLTGGSEALERIKNFDGAAFGQTFGVEWEDAVKKFDFDIDTASSFGSNVKNNIAPIAEWAGIALSAVTSGISNYDEFKDEGGLTNKRFWVETVTETAADWAIGAAATAGVAAAAAALGISAPAVAVGAAAVGVVWLVDTGVKFLTKKFGGEEKGLTEVVADLVADGIGYKYSILGNAAAYVGNAMADAGSPGGLLSNLGNAIANAGNEVADWGESWFQ